MKYSDLPIELKKTINTTFTNRTKEAFAPLLKEERVTNTVAPSKTKLIKALGKEFNLSPTLIAHVVSDNAVFSECKKEIIKRRNAVFIEEYNDGKTTLEIAAHYGLSQQSIVKAIKGKRTFYKKSGYSFASVLRELDLGTIEKSDTKTPTPEVKTKATKKEPYSFASVLQELNLGKIEKAEKTPTKETPTSAKKKQSNSFANILDRLNKSNSSQEQEPAKLGNSDYIILRRSKKK